MNVNRVPVSVIGSAQLLVMDRLQRVLRITRYLSLVVKLLQLVLFDVMLKLHLLVHALSWRAETLPNLGLRVSLNLGGQLLLLGYLLGHLG